MKYEYKCLYELTGKIEDVATFLVPITDLPKEPSQVSPMSEPNRAIAYAASGKLHELGYRYLNGEWVQPKEQEPVAWRIRCTSPLRDWVLMYRHPKTEEQFSNMEIQPLYTTPPQRTWVDLTEEDFVLIYQLCKTPIQAAEYANHLLKEKNNG